MRSQYDVNTSHIISYVGMYVHLCFPLRLGILLRRLLVNGLHDALCFAYGKASCCITGWELGLGLGLN